MLQSSCDLCVVSVNCDYATLVLRIPCPCARLWHSYLETQVLSFCLGVFCLLWFPCLLFSCVLCSPCRPCPVISGYDKTMGSGKLPYKEKNIPKGLCCFYRLRLFSRSNFRLSFHPPWGESCSWTLFGFSKMRARSLQLDLLVWGCSLPAPLQPRREVLGGIHQLFFLLKHVDHTYGAIASTAPLLHVFRLDGSKPSPAALACYKVRRAHFSQDSLAVSSRFACRSGRVRHGIWLLVFGSLSHVNTISSNPFAQKSWN